MSATQPGTAAGRALAERAKRQAFGNWEGMAQYEIPAIEAEAAAAERERIRAALDGYQGSDLDYILDAAAGGEEGE